jgi:hypothetical protein
LLDRLREKMPELWEHATVVGDWVWLELNIDPKPAERGKLRDLGFHWNQERSTWQHPCGVSRPRFNGDPKDRYKVIPASEIALRETAIPRSKPSSQEFKVISLRECPLPDDLHLCDTPQKAAEYWRLHVETIPYFNPECECFVVLMLNTRRRVKGHQLVSIGTRDTILIHPREVFRAAVIVAASALVLLHNLCASAHKECYVTRPFMWSRMSVAPFFERLQGRKECCARK